MADDGVKNALVLATSAFSSYSGCRQYRENLEAAAAAVGPSAPGLHKLRLYYNHPGFVDAVVARVEETMAPGDRLVFTAHSIPHSMAQWCDYESQLREIAGEVASRVSSPSSLGGAPEWDLAYQSRSGPPHIPWLEPDISDHLTALCDQGYGDVTVVPLGFISDHMEVMYDLDVLAAETAASIGLTMRRAATVGTHPHFVRAIRELVQEKIDDAPALWVGKSGPWPDPCPDGHCLAPAP